jgi:beta-N-acetylhexosaminidase
MRGGACRGRPIGVAKAWGLGLVALAAILPLGGSVAPENGFWAAGREGSLASSILETMSDEEVLGQLFMLAYPGDSPPPLILDWIKKRGLGGVKIFGWNAESTERLAAAVAELQTAALSSGRGIPLLVATDQEGGWIRHVKGSTTVTPGNMAIGASGLPYDAFKSAYIIGRELSALGINMNFAPTVDLATRPRSSIIGPRAFSDDPIRTAALGAAYARGLAEAGVIATAKHFPGHGDTEMDSHGVLPVIRIDEKTIWERELLPFRMLAAEGIPAIMSGHLAYPLVGGDYLPASLSRRFMTDILRGKIGFHGLAVTDDLIMSGAGSQDLSESCLMAIRAGNDLVLLSRLLPLDDPVWQRALSAYRKDPEFRARAREAAARVLETKLRYLKPRGRSALLPAEGELDERLPDPEAAGFFREQAFRSATALRSDSIPFTPKGAVLVAGPLADFVDVTKRAYPGSTAFRFSYKPEHAALGQELAAFSRALEGVDAVVVCVANDAGMEFAERARAMGKEVAVLSVMSPAPLAGREWLRAAVAVYGFSAESLAAGIDVLAGKAPAMGSLPLKLDL